MLKALGREARRRPETRPVPAALALAVALLGACGPNVEIARVPAWDPVPVSAAETVAPIAFARVLLDVPRFAPVGYAYGGGTCMVPIGPVSAVETRRTVEDPEFTALFEEGMAAAGFDVASSRSTLFEEEGATRARYVFGVRLSDLAVELCETESLIWGIPRGSTGELSLAADWEVFSTLERRVVYRTTTRGYARRREPSLFASGLLLQEAFAAAVTNLAGDEGLRTLLRDAAAASPRLFGGAAAGGAGAGAVMLPDVPLFRGDLTNHAEAVRSAVVLIRLDEGHGSGFLVRPDGLVMTNAHVVAEAEQVRVRLHDGRVRVGTVLRRDRVRDVALVQIPGDGYPMLPIRTAAVAVGETVHAIGAPLRPDLAGTLTRGVVSALRRSELDGQRYIQADVTIQGGNSGGPLVDAEGNVVGVAVAAIIGSPDRLSVGLNLFIPIAEALDRLGLGRDGPGG